MEFDHVGLEAERDPRDLPRARVCEAHLEPRDQSVNLCKAKKGLEMTQVGAAHLRGKKGGVF